MTGCQQKEVRDGSRRSRIESAAAMAEVHDAATAEAHVITMAEAHVAALVEVHDAVMAERTAPPWRYGAFATSYESA